MDNPILFYDGACKFCNSSVQYILKNEKDASFKFAHLQDPGISDFLEQKKKSPLADSIYVIQNNKVYEFSDASIKIAEQLKSPHVLWKYIKIFPRFIRNWGYKFIAKNRYRLAGRNETCLYPKELEGRIFSLE